VRSRRVSSTKAERRWPANVPAALLASDRFHFMQVGLIGAGNMARALARGWGEPVLCSDGGSGRARALVNELGGEAFDSNAEVADRADLVVLCHKPAQFSAVAKELKGHAKAVASVVGGVDTVSLRMRYEVPVFRFMPNTPVEVRRGVMCYSPEREVDPRLEHEVIALFGRLGTVVKVPEGLMTAAGAVMGVGPAYQALLAEAQVDAAVRHGMTASLAGRLVAETMAGTAELLATRDYDTLAIRREVTSPGGTTARGLAALERGGVRPAFQDAFDAVVEWGR
jgi:pyrroline-5-carboxylate reductase